MRDDLLRRGGSHCPALGSRVSYFQSLRGTTADRGPSDGEIVNGNDRRAAMSAPDDERNGFVDDELPEAERPAFMTGCRISLVALGVAASFLKQLRQPFIQL